MPYDSWLRANAPTWMQDPTGQAWMGGIGSTLDDYVQLYVAGMLAQFPDYAPSDALGALGDEMGIDRGPTETDANYATRLTYAWQAWRYAGAPAGLLVALYWAGFTGAVLVQHNGLAYQLSGAPLPTTDPASLLVVTQCSTTAVPITSSLTPSRVIPTATQWWGIDTNTDFTSRFEVLFPGPSLPSVFQTSGTATFTGVEDGSTAHPWPTVVWSNPFGDTTYKIQPSAVTITDGSGPIAVVADTRSKTTTGVQIMASGYFVGTVDVLAWQAGANPYADLHSGDLARLQSVLRKWRPAKAMCTGIYACAQGKFMGWPVQLQLVNTMGPTAIVAFAGA